MSDINNGGHAFPVLQYAQNGYVVLASGGMTLRDYFAAQAISGVMTMIKLGTHDTFPLTGPDGIAESAYRIADAMLRSRGQS